MAPPQSPAWNYFTVRDAGMAECHLCGKGIRIIRNTSPLIAHLRCKHPEVFVRSQESEIKEQRETYEVATQTGEEDFQHPVKDTVKEEPVDWDQVYREVKVEPEEEDFAMDYDMNLRMREMMALRLDDAVGDMQFRVTTDPIAQLVRALCESCLWLIRDWPNQQIDNHEAVRASRLDTLGRLRQLLRARPPKTSEMDGLILLLSDALLTISEQWPGGESESKPAPAAPSVQQQQQRRPSATVPTAVSASPSVHIPPVYGAQGTSCKPPAPKLPRMAAKPWTVDGYQQPSTSSSNSQSSSFPPPGQRAGSASWNRPPSQHKEMPQALNAGSPSILWTFFTKEVGAQGAQVARCMVCSRLVIRHNHGTSGMKSHLKVHHPAEYATLGMDSSASSEHSQSSPPAVPAAATPPRGAGEGGARDKTPGNVSAIIAALNSEPSNLPDMSNSPHLGNDIVKEEEMDYDEVLNSLNDNDAYDEQAGVSQPTSSSLGYDRQPRVTVHKSGSDIWSYFTKMDVEGEKHGCCNLCDWSRKIYNHGTNTMWAHLKKVHPLEHSILKPFEYIPAIHGHMALPRLGTTPGATVSVASGAPLKLNQYQAENEEEEED